ncbi:hypothetical protein CCH79_00000282 [Gambusia affinis]|uniref:Uncharacterized protein n=1 Tax=Gambusia affinis TaxID=33528 RepID=A0A315VWA8_GAMAF|nr:hypothetical protein CCH79_00000282 [Gambusia affinis]
MSSFDIDSLTKSQSRQMTRDGLVILLLDWLQRLKDRSAILVKENKLQEDLEKALEQIGLLNEKIDLITKELNASLKQNKYMECQEIPKNQLSEVKCYQNKVTELQTSFKNLERDSKLQIERTLKEKRQVMSQLTGCKVQVEQHESEVKKLEFELS